MRSNKHKNETNCKKNCKGVFKGLFLLDGCLYLPPKYFKNISGTNKKCGDKGESYGSAYLMSTLAISLIFYFVNLPATFYKFIIYMLKWEGQLELELIFSIYNFHFNIHKFVEAGFHALFRRGGWV